MWYAFGRFFIEGMRTDSLMLGNIRISQLLSIVFFVSALVILIIRRHKNISWYYNGINKN